MRSYLITLCLCAALLAAGGRAAAVEIYTPIETETPPGRLIDVGGYRLHLHCMGDRGPVVLFDAGLGGFSIDWIYVQELLEYEVRACAWDRAGYGWSDPGPAPRVTDHIVEELEAVLEGAGLEPPYILVGHSFGGYTMQYFAKAHPAQVAGIVLVDSSHPQQSERLPVLPAVRVHPGTSHMVTFFDPNVVIDHYPERLWVTIGALMASFKAVRTQRAEAINFNMSAAQVQAAGALPDVPLVVVTRGQRVWPLNPLGDALETSWHDMQEELAHATPGGEQVIAAHSGHLIQLEEPDLVANAVRRVLTRSCGTLTVAAEFANPDFTC